MAVLVHDEQLRTAFIKHLKNRYAHAVIAEELHVDNGVSIADIVFIGENTHCYEIKSDFDKLSRIDKQSKSYDTSFPKITLITTPNQLRKQKKTIPPYWGIISIEVAESTRIKYIQQSLESPFYNPIIALRMLWKEELSCIASMIIQQKISSKMTRIDLINQISSLLSPHQIQKMIAEQLRMRLECKAYF